MRTLCFLCTLLVLLLAIRPCCDDSICNSESTPGKLTESAPKDTDCKGCSPFFSCGTCAGFVVAAHTNYSIAEVQEHYVKHYVAYQPPHIQDVILSIWQPPQLS